MDWSWQKFYDKMMDWIVVSGPKIIAAIIVLLIGLWVVKMLSGALRKVLAKRKFNASLRYFLLNLVAISLQILVIFFAMQIAGIQLTFFAAIVAGLSVAAGLALSGTLQNFVSGILILVLKPYSVGDKVIIQNQQGTVTSILLFYTLVVTDDNKTIIVPNGQLSNNVVVNLSREGKRRVDIDLKLSYKVDFEHAKTVVAAAVANVKEVLEDPGPYIQVETLDADKYTLAVRAWVPAVDFERLRISLYENVLKGLKEKEILP